MLMEQRIFDMPNPYPTVYLYCYEYIFVCDAFKFEIEHMNVILTWVIFFINLPWRFWTETIGGSLESIIDPSYDCNPVSTDDSIFFANSDTVIASSESFVE